MYPKWKFNPSKAQIYQNFESWIYIYQTTIPSTRRQIQSTKHLNIRIYIYVTKTEFIGDISKIIVDKVEMSLELGSTNMYKRWNQQPTRIKSWCILTYSK